MFLLHWKTRLPLFPFSKTIQEFTDALPRNGMHMCRYSSKMYHPCLSDQIFLQIVNCLEEWQSGVHIKIPFSGDRYETVYQDMAALIFATSEDPYHGRKLRKLASFIASDGRYVIFSALHILLYSFTS